MATLTRRKFSDFESELKLRIGRENDGSYDGQRPVESAYLDICRFFHHHELETSSTVAVSQANETVSSPTGLWMLTAAWLESAGVRVGSLRVVHHATLEGRRSDAQGQPERIARHGSDLLLDLPADAAYTLHLRYQKNPNLPNFASGADDTPVIHQSWDERIVELAAAMASAALDNTSVAAAEQAAFARFLELDPSARLIEGASSAFSGRNRDQEHAGGAIT